MARSEHSVTIARPPDEVFDFVADGTQNQRWRPDVVDVERIGEGDRFGVGATWRQGLRGPRGGRISNDYRITVSERPSRLAFAVIAGPAQPSGTYTFTSTDGRQTTVTYVMDLQLRGLMRLVAPLISKKVLQDVTSLDNLKSVLER